MDKKILMVDDDRKTAHLVELYLKKDGYQVALAYGGQDAILKAEQIDLDLVILDLMLPQIDGLGVCGRLRAQSKVPIIMLTARTTEEDKLRGLDLGADDYVTKPFSPRELVARVRAVLRRAGGDESELPDLAVGELTISLARHEAARGGILRSIQSLIFAVRRMERGDLGSRVEVGGTRGEIGELAHAFNAMATAVAKNEQLRRHMVSDVAHELRTPLTNIRGYLEGMRDGVVEPDREALDLVFEEAQLLERLVDDLQDLALADAGQLRLERQPVAVCELVERAVAAARPRADVLGVRLRTDLAKGLEVVSADPERIGQVLRNLLSNALAHTPRGGEIAVEARALTKRRWPAWRLARPPLSHWTRCQTSDSRRPCRRSAQRPPVSRAW